MSRFLRDMSDRMANLLSMRGLTQSSGGAWVRPANEASGAIMALTIVVVAQGEMGAAIGQRLHARGAAVRTSLKGRSEASRMRARDAGLVAVDDDDALVTGADFVLSMSAAGRGAGVGRGAWCRRWRALREADLRRLQCGRRRRRCARSPPRSRRAAARLPIWASSAARRPRKATAGSAALCVGTGRAQRR